MPLDTQRDLTTKRRDSLRPSSLIRCAYVDGIIVILDFTTQKYFALDERATAIWNAFANDTLNVANQLFESAEAKDEANCFIDECLDRGLLTAGTRIVTPPPRRGRQSLLGSAGLWTALAISCLRRAARGLRVGGFTHAYELHESLYAFVPPCRSGSQVHGALAAFYRAENVVPMPNAPDDCLPRSLALFAYLRALGFACEHLIGVRRYPSLTMHAWVEVDGHVVADRAASQEFVPLARMGCPSQSDPVR